jgi:ketosteroid isomerase-like protein
MRRILVFMAALLVLTVSGCAPQVDIEAEEAAIREMDVECLKAAQVKDVERMVACYAEGASVFPANAPVVTGTEAIRASFSKLYAKPGFAVTWQMAQVEVSSAGDLAYGHGTYESIFKDPEGNPVTEQGKWVIVWKKQPDATWKMVADIWNSDGPAASE